MVLEARVPVAPTGIFQQVICASDASARCHENIFYLFFFYLSDTEFCLTIIGTLPYYINPLNAELNPICYLLALLAHHFLHVSRIRVKSLTLRLLMSYIYICSAYS